MFQRTAVVFAWVALLAIALATLSPIGFRPHLASVSVERFGAFALIGLLFGLAYPRRLGLVALLVCGAAIGLEVMQHLTPDRHGELPDALIKLVGGLSGIGLAYILKYMRTTRSTSD